MYGAEAVDSNVSRTLTFLRQLSRPTKILIAIAYDFASCVVVGLLIPFLYHAFNTLPDLDNAFEAAIAAASTAVLCIAGLRGYSTVVRFMGNGSGFTFAMSLLASSVVWLLMLQRAGAVPAPAGLLFWIGSFGLIYGSRSSLRKANLWLNNGHQAHIPVAIYGAGASGRQLVASLAFEEQYHPVAFIDDDASLHGLWVSGLKVYGPESLPDLIHSKRVKEVLLALPRASQNRRREILNMLADHLVKVQTVPSLSELLSGDARLHELRPIAIEDVLGREPVAPDPVLLRRNVEGKVVMITGAGGSIGSELCRSIIALDPRMLVLLDMSEHALFQIDHELRNYVETHRISKTHVHAIMGSVEDAVLLRQTFRTYGVDTVFHAAAYKHVPLVEMNVVEGVRNNVLGTKVLLEAIANSNVSTFVMISTDKAVRPTSVMGASKRVAELLVQAAAAKSGRCKMSIVRFGNVLGSSGSVLPLFNSQIAKGGPITVTHPEVTRFFMTIPEAAQLVIQAGALAEYGDVFHLDMGDPVRILDLARRLVRLHGLREARSGQRGDIEINIVGLRPGEKLYEELLIDSHALPTEHPRIFRARERFLPPEELMPIIASLAAACHEREEAAILSLLRRLVEGFGVSFPSAEAKASHKPEHKPFAPVLPSGSIMPPQPRNRAFH